jgi:hypothetical protein
MPNYYFGLIWVFLNVIGFVSGSLLGATSVGWIPKLIPGMAGILLGDLVFGAVIGLFQWLALKRFSGFRISAWWIVLFSLGFTFGARTGSLLTYRIANAWLTPSLVFGVFMGGSTGVAVVPLLWKWVTGKALVVWVLVSILAWILGETIAFATNFTQATVPYVAVVISTLKGLCLIWLGRSTRPLVSQA